MSTLASYHRATGKAHQTAEGGERERFTAATPSGDPWALGGEAVFITRDPDMLAMLDTAERIARSDASLLILGDSGTGKECLARHIHQRSLHPEAPYVAVNCAALPETLAESELFGHERGAFTGAVSRKAGKFEAAGFGTVVLDEISEMPLALQAKLLRVLQEREIDRVGGQRPVPLKCRIIAISNVDLAAAVEKGVFRQDLFYRINVVALRLAPLAERRDDVPGLAAHFLDKYARRHGRSMRTASPEALEALKALPWPGNVRELENAIERAVLLHDAPVLQVCHLDTALPAAGSGKASDGAAIRPGMTIREMERVLIETTLRELDHNRTRAAEMLGISIRTLRNKLREYRESRPSPVVDRKEGPACF